MPPTVHPANRQRKNAGSCSGYVQGAEAVLRIRALIASGDWSAYCRFHLKKEHAGNYPPVKAGA